MASFYVSPIGNNAWNGSSPTFVSGSTGPFLTLGAAQAAMAASGAADTTFVLDGDYALSAAVTMAAGNVGDTITNYAGASPIFRGGKLVTNFVNAGGGVWTANLTGIMTTVLQLTVDDEQQISARHPNFVPANPIRGGWLFVAGPGGNPNTQIEYDPTDFGAGQLAVGMKAIVIPAVGYTSDLMTITALNTTTHIITFDHASDSEMDDGTRFFVFGAAALLDAEREWHFNTTTKVLSYRAPAGFDGTGAWVSTGDLNLIVVDGADNVEISGLSFRDTTTTAGSDDVDTAAVKVTDCTGCVITGCDFQNVAKGVLIEGDASDAEVSESRFQHIWASAIYMKPGSSGNTLDNNWMTHTGEVFKTTGAIHFEESSGNTISHNLIEDTPRFGIGSINYTPATESGGNVIEYNKLLRTMQETPDGGAIYKFYDDADTDPTPGDIIRYNWIEDAPGVQTNAAGFIAGGNFAYCIYMDNNTGDNDILGNFCRGGSWSSIFIHGGPNNRISNNLSIIPTAGLDFGIVEFADVGEAMPGTTLHHNIVQIQTNGEVTIGAEAVAAIVTTNVHHNFYYNPTSSSAGRWGTGVTFASWQGSGYDANSSVSTSVGFTGTGTYPYTLTGGSAPLTGGYVELPWALMGLTVSFEEGAASLAVTEANDTLASVSDLFITGTLARTEANDAGSGTATMPIVGTVAFTEANDAPSVTGSILFSGSAAFTEAADTVSSVGDLTILGSAALTEAADTLATAVSVAISGLAAVIEASDTLTTVARLMISGSSASTEAADTLVATSALANTGTMSAQEASDAIILIAELLTSGNLAIVEVNDTLSSASLLPIGDWMTDTMTEITFNHGDEVVIPVVFRDAEGVIVNVLGGVLTMELWWKGAKRMTFTVGNGIELLDTNPDLAADPEEQQPHAIIRLSELQAAQLPHGKIAYFKGVFVDTAGVTISTEPLYLNKALP